METSGSAYDQRITRSVREVSHILGISDRAVRKLIRANLLYAIQVGRKHIIPLWAINEFISRNS